jgi:hypothetical protein
MGILNFRHPEQNRLNPAFQAILEGAAPSGLGITSGYRSPAYNQKIGGAKGSQHMHGKAADIDMSGMDDAARSKLVDSLASQGARGFITYTNSPNMMHVDMGIPGARPNVHFMHDKSSRNMGNAPDWMQALQAKHQGTSPQATQVSGGGGQQTLAGGSRGDTVADKGLLGDDKKRGILGGLLGPKARKYMTPDRIANLQIALEGMRLNPNQGIIGAAREGILGRRVDARDVAKEQKAGEQRNRTVEWLQSRGNSDLAAAVASGSISGQQAVGAALQPTSDGRTAQIKNYEYWKSQGIPDAEARKLARGGQTINIGGSDQKMGVIPKGFSAIPDQSNPSGYRLEPIPGGPAEIAEAKLRAEQTADLARRELSKETTGRAGGVVTEDISRALDIIDADPNLTTGIGAVLKNIPSTKAKSLSGLLETIKANIGFDRLQQMRDASKTGGALGAINKTEMDLLQAVLGNLDQALNADDLVFNLQRVNGAYMDIIHGKGNLGGSGPIPGPFKVQGGQAITDEDLFKLYGGGN